MPTEWTPENHILKDPSGHLVQIIPGAIHKGIPMGLMMNTSEAWDALPKIVASTKMFTLPDGRLCQRVFLK